MSWRGRVKQLLRGADRALAPAAHRGPMPDGPLPSIFIIGGPRSGSTLFYQSLVATRRFAYLSNLVALFPRSGALVASGLRMRSWRIPASFRSDYGDTRGLAGPSEAGDFWDEIFPWTMHHSVEAGEMSADRIEALRRFVHGLSSAYGAPFLAKNLWHSVRIGALDRALPESLFVVLHRDPLRMAQSLLEARRKRANVPVRSFSIRPRALLAFDDLPPVEHAAHQLALTYQSIEDSRGELDSRRFFDVDYAAFCADPEAVLGDFDRFLSAHGVKPQVRRRLDETFQPTTDLRLSADEIERLEAIFSETWPGGYERDRGA